MRIQFLSFIVPCFVQPSSLDVARGLSPLPESSNTPAPVGDTDEKHSPNAKEKKKDPHSLNFSSSGAGGSKARSKKRKVIVGDETEDPNKDDKPITKKSKKANKGLLSFGDEG